MWNIIKIIRAKIFIQYREYSYVLKYVYSLQFSNICIYLKIVINKITISVIRLFWISFETQTGLNRKYL